ncbi:MAG: DNA/RNA non-specific endonuclease [Gammaproteobacteria bacterium]|nr:DNA/RNA non-specific endonuclease [Gammaproteobacteria bacterium]
MRCTLISCIRWGNCLLLALVMQQLSAQTVHIGHCLAGCPAGTPAANDIVVRHLFAASINYQNGLADWVAYRVLPDTVGVASLLPRAWLADELLSQQLPVAIDEAPRFVQPDISNLQDRDYRTNELIVNPQDRGRLVPMSSFAGTPFWDDLNYLSNMAPIPVALRLGPWSRLDQAVNELADRTGAVFVVSGPLYGSVVGTDAPVDIANSPVAFFKLVATNLEHAAFVFPAASAQHSGFCDYRTSLEQLQKISSLDLLPDLQQASNDDLYRMLGCSSNQTSE